MAIVVISLFGQRSKVFWAVIPPDDCSKLHSLQIRQVTPGWAGCSTPQNWALLMLTECSLWYASIASFIKTLGANMPRAHSFRWFYSSLKYDLGGCHWCTNQKGAFFTSDEVSELSVNDRLVLHFVSLKQLQWFQGANGIKGSPTDHRREEKKCLSLNIRYLGKDSRKWPPVRAMAEQTTNLCRLKIIKHGDIWRPSACTPD